MLIIERIMSIIYLAIVLFGLVGKYLQLRHNYTAKFSQVFEKYLLLEMRKINIWLFNTKSNYILQVYKQN